MQVAPGAKVLPAQFCEPPKFVGLLGAPPEKLGVWDTPDVFLIVTAISFVAPTATLPNASVCGVTEKWLADAVPGTSLTYFRGHLAFDRMPSTSPFPD